MTEFIKTIVSAIQTWAKGLIKESTADWSQNDAEASNYVKNRTHWEEVNKVVLVDNLTFADYDNGNHPKCNFIIGQSYNVVWNGTLYENLTCFTDTEFDIIASPDNGYPFYIDDDGGNGLFIESETNDWVVSIFITQTVVHKLDTKYLSVGNYVVNFSYDADGNFVADKTFAEVKEAYDSGMTVVGKIDGVIYSVDSYGGEFMAFSSTSDGWHSNIFFSSDGQEEYGYELVSYESINDVTSNKMDKNNPVGTGSFSMNRKANTTVGINSHAEGDMTVASGDYSHAEGYHTTASDEASHAEGYVTVASGDCSHAEGFYTRTVGSYSHAQGAGTEALGRASNVIGEFNIRDAVYIDGTETGTYNNCYLSSSLEDIYCSKEYSFDNRIGYTLISPIKVSSLALGSRLSNYIGYYFVSNSSSLTKNFISGTILLSFTSSTTVSNLNSNTYEFDYVSYKRCGINGSVKGKYAHIVGNGTSETARSNAHTLDWDGNAWFAGDVYVGGTSQNKGKKLATEELILKPRLEFIMTDTVNGYKYIVQMQNGSLVSYCECTSIEVTSMPTKTEYIEGEPLDTTGMVVTAICPDGTTREITNYTCTEIADASGVATITYNELGVDYTAKVSFIVSDFNPEEVLVDFKYTDNGNGTYTITGWKETLNGEPSTEMIVPNNAKVII